MAGDGRGSGDEAVESCFAFFRRETATGDDGSSLWLASCSSKLRSNPSSSSSLLSLLT